MAPMAPMTWSRSMGVVALACLFGACPGDQTPATSDTDGTSSGEPSPTSSGEPAESTSTSTSGVDSTGTDSSGTDSTGGEELPRVDRVLADLTTAMYECPDRVWPGEVIDNYRARQVLLVSVMDEWAWLWNDQVGGTGDPPRISMGPLDAVPPGWTSFFTVGLINDVPTLGISLDETAVYNAELEAANGHPPYVDSASFVAFHEAFHFLSGQSDWNIAPSSRSVPYPEPWEPRYVRSELRRVLRSAIEDGAPLGAAAHWQSRWVTEYPEEATAIAGYDVTEGSATYAEIVSNVLAVEGCDVTEDVLLAQATAQLEDALGAPGDATSEPYDLGLLAGLLLRSDAVPGWEQAVEAATPPVEVLLADVPPVAQPDDPALQAEVQAVVDARNVEVGMEIEPMLESLASPDYYRVVVSFAWITGSFSLRGFYYLPDVPGQPTVFLQLEASLSTPSGVPIEVIDETSLVDVSTPCALAPGATIVLTLPVADVELVGGLATSTAASATFTDLAVESTLDQDGLEWLCPVDAGGANAAPYAEPKGMLRFAPSHVTPRPDGRLVVQP